MRTYAVTSGKGGVGKTNISANLAIALAKRGKRVVVFDADIGLANLDVMLGTKAEWTLQHVVAGQKRLGEVLTPGPGGIKFVAGGSGIESMMSLSGPRAESLIAELNELENCCDILIFDTGAGIDENVMTFLTAADEVLLVATPDPASLTDGYATAKAALMRKPDASIKIVMNMVDDEQQARLVFARLSSISQQFLGNPLKFGGHVRMDPKAVPYIRQRRPYFLADPNLNASRDLDRVAAAILGGALQVKKESLGDRLRGMFGAIRKAA